MRRKRLNETRLKFLKAPLVNYIIGNLAVCENCGGISAIGKRLAMSNVRSFFERVRYAPSALDLKLLPLNSHTKQSKKDHIVIESKPGALPRAFALRAAKTAINCAVVLVLPDAHFTDVGTNISEHFLLPSHSNTVYIILYKEEFYKYYL
jgi:hypothetical protein